MKTTPDLLFSTAPFYRSPLREAFRAVADAGYSSVEVMVNQDPATQEAHLLAPLASEFSLRVAAIHAPFLLMTRGVWGADPVGKIYRATHLAEEVGAPLVVAHPPYRWQGGYRRWVQESLVDFSTSTGVTIGIENMFPVRLGKRGVRFHASQALDDLSSYPFLVLDTSHAAVAGIDIGDVLRTHGDRLRHVHLSNNAGRGWDSHLPVYEEGVLPLDAFLGELVDSTFAGNVSVELNLNPWLRDAEALRDVLVRNREFCERVLAPPARRRRSRRGG